MLALDKNKKNFLKEISSYFFYPLITSGAILFSAFYFSLAFNGGEAVAINHNSFLVFHAVLEIIIIALSFAIFSVGWYSYAETKDLRSIFIGTAFLFVGSVDLMHVLSMPGMPSFVTENSETRANDYWVVARFVQAIAVFAVFFMPKNIGSGFLFRFWRPILLVGAVLSSALLFYVFTYDNYLATILENFNFFDISFFSFMGALSAIIVFLAILRVLYLYYFRSSQELLIIFTGLVLFLISEVVFLYFDGFSNAYSVIGHILRVASMFFIFHAILIINVSKPLDRLKKAEGEILKINLGLEKKIEERTSELKISKEKIEDEAKKFATLLESIGDGVLVIDRNWDIILFNKAASIISGWERADVLGKPFRECIKFIKENDRSENITFIEEAMLFGEPRQMESNTVLIRKDNRDIFVGDSAAPIFDKNKKVIGAIIVFRDVTSEHQSQRLRSDFAYASHQLRTPVNEAMWSIEAAMSDTSVEEMKAKMKTAYESVDSVLKLSNQLIAVSEIDQGSVVPNVADVNLVDVLRSQIELLAKEAEKRGIEIILKNADVVGIMSDKKILSRIIFEVLDNAVLYGKEKSKVIIDISDKTEGILIDIIGDSIGISEEESALIFTKFFRGSNISHEKSGSGLGLYIAREYAKLLNGKVWFKVDKDKGVTFSIFLNNQI